MTADARTALAYVHRAAERDNRAVTAAELGDAFDVLLDAGWIAATGEYRLTREGARQHRVNQTRTPSPTSGATQ